MQQGGLWTYDRATQHSDGSGVGFILERWLLSFQSISVQCHCAITEHCTQSTGSEGVHRANVAAEHVVGGVDRRITLSWRYKVKTEGID